MMRRRRIVRRGVLSRSRHAARPHAGDGGPATRAELNGPNMARVRPSDNAVIVIDSQNNVVRALVKNGSIVTVAGNGRYGEPR